MGKSKRNFETNQRINIITVTLLAIILLASLVGLIVLLYSKADTDKKIETINEEIEILTLDTHSLQDKEAEIELIMSGVENSQTYIDLQKESYKASLSIIENKIKSYETEEKIAYLAFIVDKKDNLDKVIETLNYNDTLAIFFTNDKEAADVIVNSGNLVGLYIDNIKDVDDIKENYKDIIEAYDPDLFMVSSDLKDKDIKIDSFYKVTENSTSEGKKLSTNEGYISDIVDTTADRDFLIIRINISNSIGVNSISGIISKLKDKNYIFLPLISTSSLIEK